MFQALIYQAIIYQAKSIYQEELVKRTISKYLSGKNFLIKQLSFSDKKKFFNQTIF